MVKRSIGNRGPFHEATCNVLAQLVTFKTWLQHGLGLVTLDDLALWTYVNLFTLSCAAFKHHGTTPLCLLNWQTLQSRCTSSVPTRTLNTRRNSTLHMTKVVDAHSLDPQPHWIGQLESTKSMHPFRRKWLCLWTLWAKQSIQMHSNSRHVKTAKDISCHTYWQTRKDGRCRLEWPISDKNTKTPQGIGWTWPCKNMWNTPPRF